MALQDARHLTLVKPHQDFRWDACVSWLWRHRHRMDFADLITYDGWLWLDAYQLDAKGEAVARREIFVQPAGLIVQRRTAPVEQPRRSRSNMRS